MPPSFETIAKKPALALSSVGQRFFGWLSVPHAPGHYYSPIPDIEEVKAREGVIWRRENTKGIPGIELNEQAQLQLLDGLTRYYTELPFAEYKSTNRRYYFANAFFSFSDAIFYYCLLRHFRPKRVIEIGSGFSSCVLLDTNDLFFDSAIRCTFIEPNPQRLYGLLKPSDAGRIEVVAKQLQDVGLDCFSELSAGDILFVDSSHVSKTGSDVNMILFDILSALPVGVHIHVHDVFYPFEYPREFVYRRWAWNEMYLLRAFLSYNREFDITIFPSFLERFHSERLQSALPLAWTPYPMWPNLRGASLWIQRVET
ncbi:MAG: class I SAM-dependent methyltransferase [Bryobacteraceae bacterium]